VENRIANARDSGARIRFLILAVLLFGGEVLIATRFAHSGFVRSSLGDVLVVILVFCLLQAVRTFERVRAAVGVFVFAGAVELSQYFHLARWLGLPRGSVLRIALGDTFQWGDLLCYLVGCVIAVALDVAVRRSGAGQPEG
jgi:hypothetical protein